MDIKIKVCDLPEVYEAIHSFAGLEKTLEIAKRFSGEQLDFYQIQTIKKLGLSINELEPYASIAKICGEDCAWEAARVFGGERVYFPMLKKIEENAKKRQIRQEYNGYNIKYLAKKYDISDMGIRMIVGSERIKEERNKPDENQITVFDLLES